MRGKLFLILIGLIFSVYGAWEGYVYLTNREPAKMTLTQFLNGNTSAKWVTLTDCQLDYANTLTVTNRLTKSDKGSYVPVRPPGATGPAMLVMSINTDAAVARMAGSAGRETVTGLIAFGSKDREKVRRLLQKNSDLAQDFKILQVDKKPEAFGLAMAPVGLVLLVIGVRSIFRKPAAPPPLPPQAA